MVSHPQWHRRASQSLLVAAVDGTPSANSVLVARLHARVQPHRVLVARHSCIAKGQRLLVLERVYSEPRPSLLEAVDQVTDRRAVYVVDIACAVDSEHRVGQEDVEGKLRTGRQLGEQCGLERGATGVGVDVDARDEVGRQRLAEQQVPRRAC
ncbi:MAG: hypothetical protein EOO27_23315 [Comamonadaceae bacterium]|nr:MAG: hypothetical protein EOO27_23315 [Comamonadaceae bacterium]